jgi:predicted glycogen debranching enzyme
VVRKSIGNLIHNLDPAARVIHSRRAQHGNNPSDRLTFIDMQSNVHGREWLETNGLGGFASGTVGGIHTRRYHGLLTAATKPPVGRMLLLSKLEETVQFRGRSYELSANRYPDGVLHPRGFDLLIDFQHDPMPSFVYQLSDGACVTKRLFMPHGHNTVVVEYELPEEATLEIRPLIAFRDYHSTTHENSALNPAVDLAKPGVATIHPYPDLPALHLSYTQDGATAETTGHWYRNFEYSIERERGLDFREDLFQPFCIRWNSGHTHIAIVAGIGPTRPSAADVPQIRSKELARRQAIRDSAPLPDPFVQKLTIAADQFLVQRGEGKTVIAGYPWFSDWGRDTMIALPGLTLTTGRPEIARQILQAFAASLSEGMLPNRFPDAGEHPEYNTVDATLWFFEAARAYAETSEAALAFVREHLVPKLRDIVSWHLRGTRYGIRVDPADGLLHCGEPGVQLTWMDAKVGDWVVTPRHGKPVEIQALWYNALRILAELVPTEGLYANLAGRVKASFNDLFWNEDQQCLYDVVSADGAARDASVRPNQIFAISLPHTMPSADRARAVVERVRRDLFTPAGLRTLSPNDPNYRPRYEGGVWERDSAYHQGTVWPWLAGPFLIAFMRVNSGSAEASQQARKWLRGFEPLLEAACFGQIPEIADGDAPHAARGCFAQAWSVAELLRAWSFDNPAGGTSL